MVPLITRWGKYINNLFVLSYIDLTGLIGSIHSVHMFRTQVVIMHWLQHIQLDLQDSRKGCPSRCLVNNSRHKWVNEQASACWPRVIGKAYKILFMKQCLCVFQVITKTAVSHFLHLRSLPQTRLSHIYHTLIWIIISLCSEPHAWQWPLLLRHSLCWTHAVDSNDNNFTVSRTNNRFKKVVLYQLVFRPDTISRAS